MGRREKVVDKRMRKMATERLEDAIRGFVAVHGHDKMDKSVFRKVGNFILALVTNEPTIPLQGKRLRDLSSKQRILFNASFYEGTLAGDFLGHWLKYRPDGDAYFLFSKRTVIAANAHILRAPSAVHKTLVNLCQERPDPVISYDRLAMAVPRFVRDMNGKMKYMSIDANYRFENAEEPGKGLWIRTDTANMLLSILNRQDVHIHRSLDYAVIYNRWFGAYFEGA